jgi:hypothetical protein
LEQQVFGGLLLTAAAGLGVAIVSGERRGLLAGAILALAGAIYFAVVWRLQLRANIDRALARARPAPDEAAVAPTWLAALRGTGLALTVCGVAGGFGYLHLAAVSLVVVLGVGATAMLRAAKLRAFERAHGVTVLRGGGEDDDYLVRRRTVDTDLPLMEPPA